MPIMTGRLAYIGLSDSRVGSTTNVILFNHEAQLRTRRHHSRGHPRVTASLHYGVRAP